MVVRTFHGGTRLTSHVSIKNTLFLRFGCRKNDGVRELWILVLVCSKHGAGKRKIRLYSLEQCSK